MGGRRRPAGRGWGRWWGGRRWVAAGERRRERKGKRERKGGRRWPIGRGWGQWWGARGGCPSRATEKTLGGKGNVR
ncbi:hypothetical protein TIFTF001_025158 [Ficus carica]|uniref:Uncharacterized protein n=1 Tax=Ficus carica TaxID=3494 RepID=A0AA88DDY1_FICCA|nr:hypothetical protein TIFTF001_025158 [Ficus carica]